MAAVDDYLEVRPEDEERLRALAASGRLTMGPWYILMDEFLVSGETIVRDLQMGLARAAAFGGAMDVGYLPDMFGHVAQMPQILPAGRLRARRGVAGRALGDHQDRLLLGGARRLERAGRVPAGRLRQRGRAARRRQGAGAPGRRPRAGDRLVPHRRPAADERLRPPAAPALAGSGGRRGQRPPGRLRLRDHLAARLPGHAPRPTVSSAGRASCARAPGPTC